MRDPAAAEALALLRELTGDADSTFRDKQLEVILSLVVDRRRVLLVQRTGWGKSAVYFIATRMLRNRGAGPTLLVSPLLALMRNQLEAAERMGVRAETINSVNHGDWEHIASELRSNEVDLLLISPERLANASFDSNILPTVCQRSGLLVVDEAHCISDWGHDFRPDYRRIGRLLPYFPTGVPVICCTATANNRVVDDIASQLGSGLTPVRGPLARDGLHLAVLELPKQAVRLAWLATNIPKLPGTGIVYCLTVPDTERVAGWLRSNGISAVAYFGKLDSDQRVRIEQDLLRNQHKVVVATVALGMGFDKPDLAFVIHYQSPDSPIKYYQQVGRAGRALPESWGVLLRGTEDTDIQDHFIRSAFPEPDIAAQVMSFLEDLSEPTTFTDILNSINVRPNELEQLLKLLEVEGGVERVGTRWLRTLKPWTYDRNRMQSVTALRRAEQVEMRHYIRTPYCRMQFLSRALDDPVGKPCGHCDNCSDLTALKASVSSTTIQRATEFLRSPTILIAPRKKLPNQGKILPNQGKIAANRRLEVGRVLAKWGGGKKLG